MSAWTALVIVGADLSAALSEDEADEDEDDYEGRLRRAAGTPLRPPRQSRGPFYAAFDPDSTV